jgi:hypothetical protein
MQVLSENLPHGADSKETGASTCSIAIPAGNEGERIAASLRGKRAA